MLKQANDRPADQIPIANCADTSTRLFFMTFGVYGWEQCYVWADSAEQAIDEGAAWLADTKPGSDGLVSEDALFNDKGLWDEARSELGPGASDEDLQEYVTTDLTYTESGYLDSWTIDDVVDEAETDEVQRRCSAEQDRYASTQQSNKAVAPQKEIPMNPNTSSAAKVRHLRGLLRKAKTELQQVGRQSDVRRAGNLTIPRPPRDYTSEDQEATIDFFASMSLKELRRRQDLTQQQLGSAFEQRNDDALGDLQMLENLLMAAVDRKEFGRDAGVRTADNFQRPNDFEEFYTAYCETALWSTNDESDEAGGDPLDDNYTKDDIASECLTVMRQDCLKFFSRHYDLVEKEIEDDAIPYGPDYGPWGHVGHDFWLTRNGHGAGFWDGDYSDDAGEILTEASEQFGETDLYVHDGQIYCQ